MPRKKMASKTSENMSKDLGVCVSTPLPLSAAADPSSGVINDRIRHVVAAADNLQGNIDNIIEHHRKVMFLRKQRIRINNSLSAFIRTQLGWSLNLPEKERDKIAKQAAKIIKDGGGEYADLIVASKLAAEPFELRESNHGKTIDKIAVNIPVWPSFGKPIKGFGLSSFGTIIALTGNLSNYSNRAKVWKRLGLAVIDGRRQGAPGTNASKEDWIEHGYSPVRRSQMFVIGDTMLKAQIRKVLDSEGNDTGERKALGTYGTVYLNRKRYELERDPEIKPIIAHRRAQRYMEKKLISDLWIAWRRVTPQQLSTV